MTRLRSVTAVVISILSYGGAGLILIGRPLRAIIWALATIAVYPLSFIWPLAGPVGVLVIGAASVFDTALATPKRLPNTPIAVLAVSAFVAFLGTARLAERLLLIEPLVTDGESMSPTLLSGDHFLIDHTASGFVVGNIVVYSLPNDRSYNYVHRIVAVGGEIDSYTFKEVPHGMVYVVGDGVSGFDSRVTGPIAISDIKGRAMAIHFSFANGHVRWHRIGAPLDETVIR